MPVTTFGGSSVRAPMSEPDLVAQVTAPQVQLADVQGRLAVAETAADSSHQGAKQLNYCSKASI